MVSPNGMASMKPASVSTRVPNISTAWVTTGPAFARHPNEAARTLLACGNGITFHRLTVDPDAEIRPVIERAVRACMD